jgi:hypothetical protein
MNGSRRPPCAVVNAFQFSRCFGVFHVCSSSAITTCGSSEWLLSPSPATRLIVPPIVGHLISVCPGRNSRCKRHRPVLRVVDERLRRLVQLPGLVLRRRRPAPSAAGAHRPPVSRGTTTGRRASVVFRFFLGMMSPARL